MTRGDIVTIALQGDHGKPRPAVIIQSDQLRASTHVALLLLTSFPADAPLLRIAVQPTAETGLLMTSYVILDRITTAPRNKVGRVIGRLDDATMLSITRSLAVVLGFG